MAKAKLEDFGQKIGGARKDLWGACGLSWSDTKNMSASEKSAYVKRDNIWQRTLFNGGDDQMRTLAYWKNAVRLSIYSKPKFTGEEEMKRYVDGVRSLKDEVDKVNDTDDIYPFYQKMMDGVVVRHTHGRYYSMTEEYNGVVNGNKFLKYGYQNAVALLKRDMDKEGFGLSDTERITKDYLMLQYPKDIDIDLVDNMPAAIVSNTMHSYYFYGDASELTYLMEDREMCRTLDDTFLLLHLPSHRVVITGSKERCNAGLSDIVSEALMKQNEKKPQKKKSGKIKWIPPQLSEVKRTGDNYRLGSDVTGKLFMDTFGVRGAEFGNWENQRDRQVSLNMAFDALKDLSRLLDIEEKDISLPGLSLGSLALAFGARGRSAASAHYEPKREVINLTKMNGAGSLGHEWGHALDDFIAKSFGITDALASERISLLKRKLGYPKAFAEVMHAMHYSSKPGKCYTDYYSNSQAFDAVYSKTGNGYWASDCEMFARAFAVYLLDKAKEKGIRNDYLSGHAESNKIPNGIVAYPVGEERAEINKAMDRLIAELKEIGLLHNHDWEAEKKENEAKHLLEHEPCGQMDFVADCDGQLCFM